MFVSTIEHGVDAACTACGVVILAKVDPRQFAEVLFRCPTCSTVVGARRRPGDPVLGVPVMLQVETIPVPAPRAIGAAMLVGPRAVAEYARETGRAATRPTIEHELTGALVREAAASVREALGESYALEEAADQRGRTSPTPPPDRHRIVHLVEYAEQAARAIDSEGNRALHADLVMELMLLREQLERWRHHPMYDHICHDLAPRLQTRHTIALLVAAGVFVDRGVGVEFVASGTGSRRGDLWIYPNLATPVGIEVKAPALLWSPSRPIDPATTQATASRLLKKAIDQLDRTRHSMLVLAGFNLHPSWRILQRATEAATRATVRRPNFIGTILVNIRPAFTPDGATAPWADMRIVRNPRAPAALFPDPGTPPPTIPPPAYEVPSFYEDTRR